MNTKHQKIESDIFIMPVGDRFLEEINTVIFACNCSGPLVQCFPTFFVLCTP